MKNAVIKSTVIGVILAGVVALPVNADNYFGVRYAALEYKIKGGGGTSILEWDTPLLLINAGHQFNSYFAVEGRLGVSAGDDNDIWTVRFDDTSASAKLEWEVEKYYGVFARFGASVNEKFYPYALVGYGKHKRKFKIASTGTSGKITDDDIGYGVGAHYNFSDRISANIEYMNYYDQEVGILNNKLAGFAVGVEYRF